jgi:flagellar export protein FliJ
MSLSWPARLARTNRPAWAEPPPAVDALAVLARLARQHFDAERQALAQTEQAADLTRMRLIDLRETAERERCAARALTDGHAWLMTYLRHVQGQAKELAAELCRLESQREAQVARLAERHAELKRLEILIERRAERARAERLRREQQAIDELVLLCPGYAPAER